MSTSEDLTLHHLTSSQSMRILFALEDLKVPYNLNVIKRDISRSYPQLDEVHPLGKSPVLTDKGRSFAESRIILQYLKDYYSSGAWDKSGDDKFRDDYFAEFSNATLSPKMMMLMFFELIPAMSPWYVKPLMNGIFNNITPMFKKDLDKPFQLMEEALSKQPYFGGDNIGLSDFSMSWPMDWADQRKYIDFSLYPNIKKWYDSIRDRESYKVALEKGGPYDLVFFEYK
ncbi:glutathione S-transferase [Acrasis kona]|uniref:Glutathione S-transferase n=1 Tax=Acrasis kona TaxID=1008807 RepID=A0AAW2YVD4_9EUKA